MKLKIKSEKANIKTIGFLFEIEVALMVATCVVLMLLSKNLKSFRLNQF